MDFIKECIAWFIFVFRKSFVISGRASRREYWMFYLAMFVITIALAIFDHATGLTFETEGTHGQIEENGITGTIFGFVMIPASITAYIRRLHDVGKSGWFTLLPFLGAAPFALYAIIGQAAVIIGVITLVALCGYCVYLAIRKGDIGPNQYGPDPLERNY